MNKRAGACIKQTLRPNIVTDLHNHWRYKSSMNMISSELDTVKFLTWQEKDKRRTSGETKDTHNKTKCDFMLIRTAFSYNFPIEKKSM